jgi:multiple sugar transport system substrate-binding protein
LVEQRLHGNGGAGPNAGEGPVNTRITVGSGAVSRRKIVAGSAAGLGSGILAACGASSGGTNEATSAPTKLSGTIEFWQWGVSYTEGFDKLAAEFNEKNPGIKVNHTRPEGYDDKIKVTVAAGSGAPDVYLMRGNLFKNWAQDGLAIDIDQYATRDKAASADLKNMHKGFYDYYHHNGKLYGAPWDFSTIMVAYSLDALESRGLKPPAELGAAWDWNTFLDYAKRLTPGDGSKYGVDAVPGIEKGFYNWVVANGGSYWSDDYKKCTVNSPQFLEACEQYFSLATRLQATAPRAWKTQMVQGLPHESNLLTNGNVAMQTAGDWHFVWYERVPGFRWDVAPIPYAPRTKKTGSIANFRGLSMAPTTQNKELGWAWISFLLKREVQDRVPALVGEVPARMDSIDSVYLNPAKSPSPKNRKILKASIDSTFPLPSNPYIPYPDVNTATNALQVDAYDGKKPVKDAINEMQDKLTAQLSTNVK